MSHVDPAAGGGEGAAPDGVAPPHCAAVQDALAAAIRAYAAKVDEEPELMPFRPEHAITKTEAARAAAGILKAAGIEFFELAIFDAWSR